MHSLAMLIPHLPSLPIAGFLSLSKVILFNLVSACAEEWHVLLSDIGSTKKKRVPPQRPPENSDQYPYIKYCSGNQSFMLFPQPLSMPK